MRRWTFEDSLKVFVLLAATSLFLLLEGPRLAKKLNLNQSGPALAAEDLNLTPEEQAHQEALDIERRFPMVDVIGYGIERPKGKPVSFVLFTIVDRDGVRNHEEEVLLAVIHMAKEQAEGEEGSLLAILVRSESMQLIGAVSCPVLEFGSGEEMSAGGCEVFSYPSGGTPPIPERLILWRGVGR